MSNETIPFRDGTPGSALQAWAAEKRPGDNAKVPGHHPVPVAEGGCSRSRVQSLATTNLAFIKAAKGQIYGIHLANFGPGPAFLKLYNKASAPVLGIDTPLVTHMVPAGGRLDLSFASGAPFDSGIARAITGGPADADTAAVDLNQVMGEILFA